MSRVKNVSMAQNSALIEKCAKAKERLLIKMATSLREDMARMLDEELHSDLLITSDKTTIPCHRMMLKCRVSSLMHKLMYSSRLTDKHYQLQNVKTSDLKTFISQLYTTEYIDVLVDEYTNKLFPQQTSIQAHNEMLPSDLPQCSVEGAVDLRTSGLQAADGNLTRLGCDKNNPQEFTNAHSDRASCNAESVDQVNVDVACEQQGVNNGQRETTLTSTISGIDVDHSNSEHSRPCDKNYSLTEDIHKAQNCKLDNSSLNPAIKEKSNVSVTPNRDENAAVPNKDNNISDKPDSSSNIDARNSRPVPYDVCSQLGQDMLRVLVQKVDSDCVLSASGKDFKCHKCVLAARSQYFSAMLSGAWLEIESDKISLDSVSPAVLEQALLYMYGGVVDLLGSCDLAELIRTADMFALDGLREVAVYNIQTLCHLFHKPCAQCLASIPDALNLSVCYNLPELQDKCVKWINKNILKVWPTKPFSCLPDSVLDLCCSAAIKDMTVDSVIGVIMDCDRLSGAMPRVKWSECVMALNTQLMDTAIEFTSKHFTEVISSKQFIALGQDCSWGVSLLDGIFSTVTKSLPVESACKTYLALHTLNVNCQSEMCTLSDDFKEFVGSLFVKCESYMKVYVQQVANSRDWPLLNKDMQTQILQAGSYIGFDNLSRGKGVPPKLTSQQKKAPAHIINSLRESSKLSATKEKNHSRWSPDREARAAKPSEQSVMSHDTDSARSKPKAGTSVNKAAKQYPTSSAAIFESTPNKHISKQISMKDCHLVDITEPSRKFKVKKIPTELKSKGPMKAVPLKDVCVESQGDTRSSNNENIPSTATRMRSRRSSFGFSPTRPEASRTRRNSEGSSWSSQRTGSSITASWSSSCDLYDRKLADVSISTRRESLKGSHIPVLKQRSRSMMDLKSLEATTAKPGAIAKSQLPKLLPMFDIVFLMPDKTNHNQG